MSNEAEAAAEPAAKRNVRFRKAFVGERPAPGVVGRQSEAALLAWNTLGADRAMLFLNTYHPGLDGRPVDIAGASDNGLSLVAAAIAADRK